MTNKKWALKKLITAKKINFCLDSYKYIIVCEKQNSLIKSSQKLPTPQKSHDSTSSLKKMTAKNKILKHFIPKTQFSALFQGPLTLFWCTDAVQLEQTRISAFDKNTKSVELLGALNIHKKRFYSFRDVQELSNLQQKDRSAFFQFGAQSQNFGSLQNIFSFWSLFEQKISKIKSN